MSNYKYSFKNDYSELAHPTIIEAFIRSSIEQNEGYGLDVHSEQAREAIQSILQNHNVDIHFVSGGTQANLIVLSSILRPHEAVIACESGHIFVHETGAIEATGHKICTVKSENGKLTADHVHQVCAQHTDEHMVKPKVVFISQSTELGTVYTKQELADLRNICQELGLYLYMDGARLGAGLASSACDVEYTDLTQLLDVFYIGGTKNGALFGEAIVIVHSDLKADFRYHMKQKGGMLAKGSSMGIQFAELFISRRSIATTLYEQLALHNNKQAMRLAHGIKTLGFDFMTEPTTNQLFPILPKQIAHKLSITYGFYIWEDLGENVIIRLVTSWAITEEVIDGFLEDLHASQI